MACVLLGVEDEPVVPDALLDFKVNKAGGKPDWCVTRSENPACGSCGSPTALAVQVYAPLDNSDYHRTLYLFACISCRGKLGSWTCVRDQLKDATPATLSSCPVSAITSWLGGEDDWGDEEGVTSATDGISLLKLEEALDETPVIEVAEAEIETGEEETISLDQAAKQTKDLRALLGPAPEVPVGSEFASFYINVIEEQISPDRTLDARARELWMEYQRREGCDWKKETHATGAVCESYEKANQSDRLVHKFISRLQSCPEQLLRYCRGSTPLLLEPIEKKLMLCEYCEGPTVFEMQVLPELGQRLVLPQCSDATDVVQFGTIIIFTCSASCWADDSGPRKETTLVQCEMF